jgi:hypothetical protein
MKYDDNLNKSITNPTTPPHTTTTSNYLSKRHNSETPVTNANVNSKHLPIRTHSIASSGIFANGREFTNLNDRFATTNGGDDDNDVNINLNHNLLDLSQRTQSSTTNHNDSINIDIDDDLVKACIITNLNAAAAVAKGSHNVGFASSIISSFSGGNNTCGGDDGSMSSEVTPILI